MIRLAIVVEGETEEEFVKSLLAGHLLDSAVEAQPIKPGGQGGNISVERLVPEMVRLQWSFDFVTSLAHFYGFRRKREGETVEQLEARIDEGLNARLGPNRDPSRAFAYVQQHEFEGLLFSDVNAFHVLLGVSLEAVDELRRVRASFPTPEDIDDGRETAPSKRIEGIVPSYRKRTYGPLLAQETGLPRMRAECPRFNAWVSRLEPLGSSSTLPTSSS